jgi:hypothetical protein
MNSDGEPACAGRDVVPREGSLAAFVEPAVGGERERMGGDDGTGAESIEDV